MSMRIDVVAGFVVGVAFFSGPALAEEPYSPSSDSTAYATTPPRDFADVKLATAGRAGRQAVAVNPKNLNVLLATYAGQGSCWVRTSTNAGQTWGNVRKLAMPSGKPNCDVPAVIWAPDGDRVYAAYSYRIPYPTDYGVTLETGAILSYSTDKGLTWSVPKIVEVDTFPYSRASSLKAESGFPGALFCDSPELEVDHGTPLFDGSAGSGARLH